MITTSVRRRRGAALAAGSLVASTALVLSGMTSASAADTQVGPDDVAGFENGDETSDDYNYDEWHVGSVTDPDAPLDDSLTFGECSVELLAPPDGAIASVTQLLKGYPIDARPDTVEEIAAVLETLSTQIEGGSVTLQLPFFIYPAGGEPDDRQFTTIRNRDPFTEVGVHTLEDEVLISSRTPGEVQGTAGLLENLAQAFESGGRVELLGVGVAGDAGSVVSSLTAGPDTAFFGTGDCLPEPTPGPGDDDDAGAGGGAGDGSPQAPTRPIAVETGR